MKPRHWLCAGFAGLLSIGVYACSAEPVYEGDETPASDGDDDDVQDEKPTRDAGRDGSRSAPRAPLATNDDDEPAAGDDDEESVCDSISIQAKSNPPDVLIVLDRSSSMVQNGANRWAPSVQAVKALTTELNDAVSFGLMLFPAPGAMAGVAQGILDTLGLGAVNTFLPEDTGCAPGKVVVPMKVSNAQAIGQALDRGAPQGLAYTPTATSLEAALAALRRQSCADCMERPTYVLLVTDGEPTCTSGQPMGTQADVDATNAAIDKLRAADIKTYVVGYNTKASPAADAAMTSFAMHGGTERYLAVENGAELNEELRRIAGSLVSCEYELNEAVEDPALVRVIIDGKTLILNEGWTLEGRKVILNEACDMIRDAKVHNVRIKKECEPQVFL